jgi:hypothetical protein
MCLCEEARRSNLPSSLQSQSLMLMKCFNQCTFNLAFYFGSNFTDCFVVPPRNDTFFERKNLENILIKNNVTY